MGAPTPFGAAGPTGPSVWGVLPWGGYGMGARYMMPLPISPLLTRTKFRDYWALEFGADILRFSYDYGLGTTAYSYSWTEIIPVVGMMWQFWINDSFAVYPKVELGYAFGWYSGTNGSTTRPLRRQPHFPGRHRRSALQAGQRHHAARRGRLRRRQGRRRLAVLS